MITENKTCFYNEAEIHNLVSDNHDKNAKEIMAILPTPQFLSERMIMDFFMNSGNPDIPSSVCHFLTSPELCNINREEWENYVLTDHKLFEFACSHMLVQVSKEYNHFRDLEELSVMMESSLRSTQAVRDYLLERGDLLIENGEYVINQNLLNEFGEY